MDKSGIQQVTARAKLNVSFFNFFYSFWDNACRSDGRRGPLPALHEIYYIVPDKCTECVGFHEEPQCAAVCPVDCCVPDENNVESREDLLGKQQFMHNE